METGRELAIRDTQLPDSATLEQEMKTVRVFQQTVQKLLIKGHDYGVIPGTGNKPTLLKPGAEKIDKILHLADTYFIEDKIEDWEKGFFFYTIKCRLVVIGTDVVVAEGMGSCNSREIKYRYRWVFESALGALKEMKDDLPTKSIRVQGKWTKLYRIENENPEDQLNTILKMAKKRAHVDASLSAGRLSDIFTQDIEDMKDSIAQPGTEESPPEPTRSKSTATAPKKQPEPQPEAEEQEEKPEELSGAASRIDPEWLKETLELIHWKPVTALSWIKAQCRIDVTDKLETTIAGLTDEDLKKFMNHITSMREVAGG